MQHKKIKRQVIDQEKILAKYISDIQFVSTIYNELLEFKNSYKSIIRGQKKHTTFK